MDFEYITNNDEFILVNPILVNDISKINNYIVENTNDILIPFNTQHLINSIFTTFKNNKEIYKQFKLDMLRTNIYYSKIEIEYRTLYNFLYSMRRRKIITDYKLYDMLMCFTQAVLYWPYSILQEIHSGENVHVAELSNSNKSKKNYNYTLYNKNGSIYIIIKKQMRIFELDENDNDKTLKTVKIELTISFTDNCSLLRIM